MPEKDGRDKHLKLNDNIKEDSGGSVFKDRSFVWIVLHLERFEVCIFHASTLARQDRTRDQLRVRLSEKF